MRDHRYPKLAGHIELHQAIIRALDGLKADLESAKDVEDDLAGMLRVWIVKHIDIEDMEYAVFLGTAPPADRA
jgi:hemerythrin